MRGTTGEIAPRPHGSFTAGTLPGGLSPCPPPGPVGVEQRDWPKAGAEAGATSGYLPGMAEEAIV